LADALSYGMKFKPRLIVDVATLTGQQWNMSCGLFGSIMGFKEDTIRKFIDIGKQTNDRLVEMPLLKEFVSHTKSNIADVKNAEYKCDKTSTAHAGAFLSNFVDEKSNWIHIDVAGPSFIKQRTQGYGVRLLTEVIKEL
jgi:leucyl aminopeptidase